MLQRHAFIFATQFFNFIGRVGLDKERVKEKRQNVCKTDGKPFKIHIKHCDKRSTYELLMSLEFDRLSSV
jgi:hypothetical protein